MPLQAENLGAASQDVIAEFLDLQNQITDSLEIKNARYIYSEKKIRTIIMNSKFDFDLLNRVTGSAYSAESFAALAINRIKNANVTVSPSKTACVYGTYCGRNYVQEGWNYYRTYADKENSSQIAADLSYAANNWNLVIAAGSLGALASGVGAALAAGIAAGAAYNAWYGNNMASAINYNNTLSNCGTVTDVNIYTTYYTCYNQANFHE